MGTLYRKVAVSERLPKEESNYFFMERGGFDFKLEAYRVSKEKFFRNNFNYWLEEIPDTSHQLENLEAEKKDILHFLKYFKQCVEDEDFLMVNNTDEDVVNNVLSKMNSLIQKHKQ